MSDTSLVSTLSLTKRQKIRRAYGIWWDLINTGIVVFILALAFLLFSMALLSGRIDILPLQDLVWAEFARIVAPEKQLEIGVGILGVTVSGASAAALYLVRVGTSRWSMNRRIGFVHEFFAEEIARACATDGCNHEAISPIVEAFLHSAQNAFSEISETHSRSQFYFERARMQAHIFLVDKNSGNLDAIDIARDLLRAALICQKKITVPRSLSHLVESVAPRILD